MNKINAFGILSIFSTIILSVHAYALEVPKERLSRDLEGGLRYLEVTQIQDRKGKGDCRYDSYKGSGCSGRIKNIRGEWTNDIHPLFLRREFFSKSKMTIPDSNMFVTGAILYPLYWIDDDQGRISNMRKRALESFRYYKRGKAYSFWPKYIHRESGELIIGPVNFRVDGVDVSNSFFSRAISKVLGFSMPWVEEWMNEILDEKRNPHGFASFMNVPNDADDTSVAISLQTIEAARNDELHKLDLSPLEHITQFRDEGRLKSDKRDTWTSENTGAYLTWLKDENLPIFGDYESGVMPLGVNNVDCVVNANVVFALALNDMKNAPGYRESLSYLSRMINKGQWWKTCAMYYPQKFTFAYAVTRAYRDGGARSVEFSQAMNQLMVDILHLQRKSGKWCSEPDNSCHYATAMALTSLLNLGEERARSMGYAKSYAKALDRGFNYLSRSKKINLDLDINNETNFGNTWNAGLFFSADDYRLGVWRSAALTNAMVIEALSKFLTNYHKSNKNILEWNKTYKLN